MWPRYYSERFSNLANQKSRLNSKIRLSKYYLLVEFEFTVEEDSIRITSWRALLAHGWCIWWFFSPGFAKMTISENARLILCALVAFSFTKYSWSYNLEIRLFARKKNKLGNIDIDLETFLWIWKIAINLETSLLD